MCAVVVCLCLCVCCSRVFRKLHLEVVQRQDDLHVIHVVMYPRCDPTSSHSNPTMTHD